MPPGQILLLRSCNIGVLMTGTDCGTMPHGWQPMKANLARPNVGRVLRMAGGKDKLLISRPRRPSPCDPPFKTPPTRKTTSHRIAK
jgi:hypothetical protein